MKVLISGICGFVGSTLAATLKELDGKVEVSGFDNFIRPGSESNRLSLKKRGITVCHADLRSATDIDMLPPADFVIDAAANPSVLAGVDGRTSSRQLLEHNLQGTVNLLEYCKSHKAGFVLLSTSRVYSVAALAQLPVRVERDAFVPDDTVTLPVGLSAEGVSEKFDTTPPLSLYGSSKLASEVIALEYASAFGFPVWINRCGVLAGAGQFGRPDQGIFSFWINSYLRRRPLKYIGFGGSGYQTRDCLHPSDVAILLQKQMRSGPSANGIPPIVNVGGGRSASMSLAQLSAWCAERFGEHPVVADTTPRPFDIPWFVMDNSLVAKTWGWKPQISLDSILDEIAVHGRKNPDWLELSEP